MPAGIVGRLLGDPQQFFLHVGLNRARLARDREVAAGRGGCPDSFRELAQGSLQPENLKLGRAKIPNLDARFTEGGVHLLLNAVDDRSYLLRERSSLLSDAIELQRHSGETLQQCVVQVARNARPL